MSDLVEFLLARVAEDEAAARAATPGPWRWENEEFDGEPCAHESEWTDHGPNLVTVSGTARRYLDERWLEPDAVVLSASGYDASSVNISRADASHIARHDPARALAECDAKRRIIGTHNRGLSLDGYTLRAMAEVYANHEDYREDWRP